MAAESSTFTEAHFQMPAAPMYLNSWCRVRVALTATDPPLDDLVFTVEPLESGCSVSPSRDDTFDPNRPDIVLIAGGLVGDFELVGRNAATGDEVLRGTFSVTDAWSGTDGPPVCVIGATSPGGVVFTTHTGPRKVAIVVAQTADATALPDTDAATLRAKLEREVFGGFDPIAGLILESTNAYFAEVSDGLFSLENAGVVGPIDLPSNWTNYSPAVVNSAKNQWNGLTEFSKAGVARLRDLNKERADAGEPPLVDLLTVESIIFVMRSLPPDASGNPGATQWPWASGDPNHPSFQVDTDSSGASVTRTIECVAMPDDWEAIDAGNLNRRIRHTAAHELCHNLGLSDEYADASYTSDIKKRDLKRFTLMSIEQNFPQLTTPERLQLGWVDRATVKTVGPGSADESVTLRATSLGPPQAGEFAALELNRSPNISYYFEYRTKRSGRISDQDLQARSAVIGIDWLGGAPYPPGRRQLQLMRNDADNDGGVYPTGSNYVEETTTKPEFPVDLLVDVSNADGNTAKLHLHFGDRKPDPALTPFSAESGWKSADLEVQNAKSDADPRFKDTPWEDHVNWLVAHVHNVGDFDADKVDVSFYVKDFTVNANAPEVFIGNAVDDVPAGATVDFSCPFPWMPPAGGNKHYCVIARIEKYAVPGHPEVPEVTQDNNQAQSNYFRFISKTASPASRETCQIALHGIEIPARQYIAVAQSSPIARTFLNHAWVNLRPGQTRTVLAMTESMVGDPAQESYVNAHGGFEGALENPNFVRFTGIADEGCGGVVVGGASISVHTAIETEFGEFAVKPGGTFVFGRVVESATGSGVFGKILVSVRYKDTPAKEFTATGDVDNGDFGLLVEHGFQGDLEVRGHFLHSGGFADCDSQVVEVTL
jgi:M6 family metalloprotease-like protein